MTLTVTDVNGNESEATATVTVEDNIAPQVVTQDVTVAYVCLHRLYAGADQFQRVSCRSLHYVS